eukprot:Ihof_evm11s187 gene=Ihof_evmTU11s187
MVDIGRLRGKMRHPSACVIEEPVKLCTCTNEVLGVKKQTAPDHITLTVARTVVHVYDVAERRIISSSSLTAQQTLTHPIIQNDNNRLYSVDNNKVLRSWAADAAKLEDGLEAKSRLVIGAVHTHSKLKGVLVLFGEGSAVVASETLEMPNRHDRPLAMKTSVPRTVVYSTLVKHTKNELVALGLYEGKEGDKYSHILQVYTIDVTDTSAAHHEVVPAKSYILGTGESLVTASFDPITWTIVTIDQNGCMGVWDVPKPEKEEKAAEGLPARMERNLHVFKWERGAEKNKAPWIAAQTFSGNYVAILGEDLTNGYTLCIWDTIYGVLHAQRKVRAVDQLAGTKGYSGGCQLLQTASNEGTLFVTVCGRHVDVCPVFCSPLTLATALGRMRETGAALQASDAKMLTEAAGVGRMDPTEITNLTTVDEWNAAIGRANDEASKVLNELIDPNCTPTLDSFTKTFMAFYGKVKKSKKEGITNGRILSLPFVSSVMARCLECKDFWPGEVVSTLLKTGRVSAVASRGLFEVLREGQHLAELELAIIFVKDVPEATFIQLLQFVLDPANQSLLDKYVDCESATSDGDKKTESEGVNHFLSLALASMAGDVFLQACLIDLPSEHVVALLQYLLSLLMKYHRKGEPATEVEPTKKQPTLGQVTEWLQVLMDSQLSRLLLLPECHPVLRQIKECVSQHIAVCNKLL